MSTMDLDPASPDRVFAHKLSVKSRLGTHRWGIPQFQAQPLSITLAFSTDLSVAGGQDDLASSIDYAQASKTIIQLIETAEFPSIAQVMEEVMRACLPFRASSVTLHIEQPAAFPSAAAAVLEATMKGQGIQDLSQVYHVVDCRLSTLIGVYAWERERKQPVIVNLSLVPGPGRPELSLEEIVRALEAHVEASQYKTLEGLVASIADLCLENSGVQRVRVKVEKPKAMSFADSAGVEITRARRSREVRAPGLHTAFVGFGSNLGERSKVIQEALGLIKGREIGRIVDSSFLYETSPMYETDQPNFLNGVVKLTTTMEPLVLLEALKKIERDLGRKPAFPNAARPIDLDILLYDDLVLESKDLGIPHTRMLEREFVLRPLSDIADSVVHPTQHRTIGQLLADLLTSQGPRTESTPTVSKALPLQNQTWAWSRKTYIMAILNRTPDSFSCSGEHFDLKDFLGAAEKALQDGADILDIGGMSTRPGADESLTVQEEINRVVPAIQALRQAGYTLPISIDTYRADVAEAALKAGADMINDVRGGQGDPRMLEVMARAGVPVVLMHCRGNAATMTSVDNTTYEDDDVVGGVASELGVRLGEAIAAGVYRWNIMADPGLGFAKAAEQSYELLRRLKDVFGPGSPLAGFPSLLGPSRKGFIRKGTGRAEVKGQDFGTAGAVAACIAGGANLVRVHNVRGMVDLARVCDSVWKI